MLEGVIERQAIRTAVALAAVSAHGDSPEVIADLRDEAVALIGLCIRPPADPGDVRAWCDGATELIGRLVSAGSVPESQVLHVSATVLRLRLAAARAEASAQKRATAAAPKKTEESKPEPELNPNRQKLVDFIREHPGMRSKELVAALNGVFSSRTIKRHVAELISLGILRRSALPDGGVAYTLKG